MTERARRAVVLLAVVAAAGAFALVLAVGVGVPATTDAPADGASVGSGADATLYAASSAASSDPSAVPSTAAGPVGGKVGRVVADSVNVTGSNSPVLQGENATVSATVNDTVVGNETVTLTVNGTDRDEATVDGTGEHDVTLAWNETDEHRGEFVANVSYGDAEDSTNVTVLEPAFVAVEEVEANDSVVEGDELVVEANVTNLGDVTANQTITLAVDDTVLDARNVSLDGEESETFQLAGDAPAKDGTYAATVASENDAANATISVLATGALTANVSLDHVAPDETVNGTVSVVGAENATRAVDLNATARTDAVTFEGLPADDGYAVTANASHYVPANESNVSVGQNGTSVDLDLARRTGSIAVTVTDAEDEKRVENATVRLHRFGGNESTAVNATVENGTYGFDGVPVGTHAITVSADGFEPENASATVNASETATANVTIERRDTANVTLESVTPRNATVGVDENVTVNATLANDGGADGTTAVILNVTDPNGHDVLDATAENVTVPANDNETVSLPLNASELEPGEYDYEVTADNETAPGTVTVVANASISGAVHFDFVAPNAPPNVSVTANGADADVAVERTDDGTTYAIEGIELATPANVTVAANATHYERNETAEAVHPGENVTSNLTLERSTGTVRANVTADGEPVKDATVDLRYFGAAGETLSSPDATPVNGTYVFADVPVGNHTVEVTAESFVASNGSVTVVENDTATIDLEPNRPAAANITISSVVPANATVVAGEPVAVKVTLSNDGHANGTQNVVLNLTNGDVQVRDVEENVTLVSGENETVVLDVNTTDLEPGNYTAFVRTENDTANATVEVSADPTLTATVSLDHVAPDEDVNVTVEGENATEHSVVNASAPNATVRFDGLAPNETYTVTANASRYVANRTTVTLGENGSTVGLELARHTGEVAGTVTDAENDSVANATLDLHHFDADEPTRTLPGATDANGSFAVDEVPVGNHTLVVRAEGYENQTVNVSVAANETVDVNATLHEREENGDDGSDGGDGGGGIGPPPGSGGSSPDPAPDPEPALALERVEPTDATVEVGETVEIEAVVANEGDAEGAATVEFVVGDRTVLRESVSVAAGDEETVTYEVDTSELDPDVYRTEVEAAGEDVVGALYVTESLPGGNDSENGSDDGGAPAPRGDGDDGSPGFGVLAALLALGALAAVGARRRA